MNILCFLISMELIAICILIRHIQIQTNELKKEGNKKAEIYFANHNSIITFLLIQIFIILLISFYPTIIENINQMLY